MHHVTIGQDETVRREDEARSGAFATCLLDLYVHYGRPDALHGTHYGPRVTIEQFIVVLSDLFLSIRKWRRICAFRQELQRIHGSIWMPALGSSILRTTAACFRNVLQQATRN